MRRLSSHIRSNVIGYVALFVALGGTGYAATSLPANSVGASQIRNHSITPVKLNPSTITGSVRAWALVSATGEVIASGGRPTVTAPQIDPGVYSIRWGVRLPNACATIASIDGRSPAPTETISIPGGAQPVVAGYASQVRTQTYARQGTPRRVSETSLVTLDQAGQPMALAFDVAVIC